MADRPITIKSTCETVPNQHVHVKAGDIVRWHADHSEIYFLHLKGGFFKNEPHDFQVLVLSGIWTKDYVVAGRAGSLISNYIYDLAGKNCLSQSADGPPDIIIDSTLKRPKKPGSPKKKAAPEPRASDHRPEPPARPGTMAPHDAKPDPRQISDAVAALRARKSAEANAAELATQHAARSPVIGHRDDSARLEPEVDKAAEHRGQPGTAADGDGNNSPFTTALANHLTTPGLDVRRAFDDYRTAVIKRRKRHRAWLRGRAMIAVHARGSQPAAARERGEDRMIGFDLTHQSVTA